MKQSLMSVLKKIIYFFLLFPLVTLFLFGLAICIANGGVTNTIEIILRMAMDLNNCDIVDSDRLCVSGSDEYTTVSDYANQIKIGFTYIYFFAIFVAGIGVFVVDTTLKMFNKDWIKF